LGMCVMALPVVVADAVSLNVNSLVEVEAAEARRLEKTLIE
jgi:hypothetical protein